jgi:hypothetical protein
MKPPKDALNAENTRLKSFPLAETKRQEAKEKHF